MTRTQIGLMRRWHFTAPGKAGIETDLPHTWNNIDGQDGGNDYYRGTCVYETSFATPDYDAASHQVWLQFDGVNATAAVTLNGTDVCTHEGGYSTFRNDITNLLAPAGGMNCLKVAVDNSVNDRVYPQKADFTFYGGIYRDVKLLIVNKDHIALGHLGGPGVKITPKVNGQDTASIRVEVLVEGSGTVEIDVLDAEGKAVLSGSAEAAQGSADLTLTLEHAHRWDGLDDPYLYTCAVRLVKGGETVDEVRQRFGIRSFRVDAKNGFMLNGRSYPLHGVSRHQDRKGIGNAITREMHDEDMALIREMGANTIRLAHYQHDQYFYDLCDQYGMVVWAEIPYISEHMPNGRANTISQMKELITQNYNHASIVCWGVSNEITISTKDKKDMLDNHHVLNDLCHEMDPVRFTTLACYAMCGPFNRVAHITDAVSWNLYLGWYIPGLFLNRLWVWFFHLCYPNRPLGFSEYGAEGMPNLHSDDPLRGDQTEEYQAFYHEYMLWFFHNHKWMWASHVWNMFDFAADARDQGGEPGMNHKGLVTFDRKTKKDSFYLYKAWWSSEPVLHVCEKRFVDRALPAIIVKVYSNQENVELYVENEKQQRTSKGKKGRSVRRGEGHIHEFLVSLPLDGSEVKVRAVAGDLTDEAVFRHVDTPNPDYRLKKEKKSSANWT